jgi:hypothetical protein
MERAVWLMESEGRGEIIGGVLSIQLPDFFASYFEGSLQIA